MASIEKYLQADRVVLTLFRGEFPNEILHESSTALFATGNAGVLYPPQVMPQEMFDVEVIQTTCLRADDLWLKNWEFYGKLQKFRLFLSLCLMRW